MNRLPRIVSLLPSATETVCALGLRDALVGVSHECDFPADVRGLPVLTAPAIDPSLGSREIDRDVRERLSSGLSIYRVDEELLERLSPDLVVTQDQCEVCAVSPRDLEASVRRLAGRSTTILSLRPSRLGDVWDDVERIARAAGVEERGRTLAESLRGRIADLAARTTPLPRPRAVVLEWLDPLMSAGHWIPEIERAAGAEPLLATSGARSATILVDALVEAAPDAFFLVPCGFPLPQTRREIADFLHRPGRPLSLPAIREGRAFAIDGNAYFNRPGPRLVESAEILAGLLHPHALGHLVVPGAAEPLATGSPGAAGGPG